MQRNKLQRRRAANQRRLRVESLETRRLLAATPLGVTPMDTGEFLLGTVGVTPVFFESNGEIDPESQDWTPEEIDEVLADITDGVNWWSDTLDAMNTVHSVEFVVDPLYADNPVETGYEPIDRFSQTFEDYVGDFVVSLGYGDAGSIENAVRQFNQDQREKLGTDWSFTIFVVDASADNDGLFPSGGDFTGAFAFAGGLFFVIPSTRPVSTFTHEMGHIFWARDEYSGGGSWTDTRGYYNAQNLNAWNNPDPNYEREVSIMRGGLALQQAFNDHVSPASTLAMIGWRDSDGDGVFDLADVPLSLDAVGYYDADRAEYHFSGVASAVPLRNQNSSGTQSDITFNRVSQVQYSLDNGPWTVAAEPDLQVAEIDVVLPLSTSFTSIRWRVIDQSTGITSPILEGSETMPALPVASISGLAFEDENANGVRDPGEIALAQTEVIVRHTDGSSLFGGAVNAADFPDGRIQGDLAGVTLAASGLAFDSEIGSFASSNANGEKVFHAFDPRRPLWVDGWSSRVALEASFDETVGEVELDAFGLDEEGSFARLEAFDASGQLIARTTTEVIALGEKVNLRVTDPMGRIASVRALGHAGTSVALNHLRFGFETTVLTDPSGGFRLSNLPDGNYMIDVVPQLLIHELSSSSVPVVVAGGTSQTTVAAAQRVNSPRFNELLAQDVNQDGKVTALDALSVINDLSRNDSRILQSNETSGFDIDVNNDGVVSAVDALLVINQLEASGGESEPSRSLQSDQTAQPASSPAVQMFNSAGGADVDESSGQDNADTEAASISAQTPRKIVATATSDQGPPSLGVIEANQHGMAAEEMTEPIQPIRPDFLEPILKFDV